MFARILLLAMLAISVIGGGTIAWVLLAPAPAVPVADASVAVKAVVLTAARALHGGVLIRPEDLAVQEVIKADIPVGASLDTPQSRSDLTGAMVRHNLAERQPILPGDLVRPGDHGFLAAVLGPNMRAITVAVDAVSGTAGLIWPGDHIDLILTQALDGPTRAVGRRVAAETVLSDVRVIAIDQQIVQGQAPDGNVAPANRTATLEVTSAQAERVLVAGHLGKLSLSVVAADQAENPPSGGAAPTPQASPSPAGVTWAGDVSPALGNGEPAKPPGTVRVFQGGSDGKEFHF